MDNRTHNPNPIMAQTLHPLSFSLPTSLGCPNTGRERQRRDGVLISCCSVFPTAWWTFHENDLPPVITVHVWDVCTAGTRRKYSAGRDKHFFYFGIKGSSGLVTLAFLPSVESFTFSNCSIWYVLKTWPDFSQGFKQSEILWLLLVSI